MFKLFLPVLVVLSSMASAEGIVATKTLRVGRIISPGDIKVSDLGNIEDISIEELIGKEMLVNTFKGRPVYRESVGEPALVERNQLIDLHYSHLGLKIEANARALERGGEGEGIRVMNLASRKIVVGRVQSDGSILVERK